MTLAQVFLRPQFLISLPNFANRSEAPSKLDPPTEYV